MRDPRTTPIAGDVLRKGRWTRRVESIAECGSAFMVLYTNGQPGTAGAWITTWRKWAKDAEVVSLGEAK
jgi:hypothetical protein